MSSRLPCHPRRLKGRAGEEGRVVPATPSPTVAASLEGL